MLQCRKCLILVVATVDPRHPGFHQMPVHIDAVAGDDHYRVPIAVDILHVIGGILAEAQCRQSLLGAVAEELFAR